MYKHAEVHPYTRIPLSSKKKLLIPRYNKNESQMHSAKWKKLDSRVYIPHDSIYMIFWKRKNYRKGNRSVVTKGWE